MIALLPLSMLVFPNQMGALMQVWPGAGLQPRQLFVRAATIGMLPVMVRFVADGGLF
ncbi:MAG: hypothetical protein P8L39_06785 [Halioglobus sp.]|nr:hypothetical protein [Halioglobus sp.]